MAFLLLLLSAVLLWSGAAAAPAGTKVHQDPDDPVVQHFLLALQKANAFVASSGESAVSLTPIRLGGLLGSVTLGQGTFSNLSSFVVDDQTILEQQEDTNGPASTVYRYNVWLHMGDLTFSYNYRFYFLGIPLGHGRLRVSPVQNAFNVIGSLNVTEDGSCQAAIEEALVLSMDILRIEFDDETWFHKVIKYSFDIIVNFVYKGLKSPIQDMIESDLNLNLFRKQFSSIYCQAFLQ